MKDKKMDEVISVVKLLKVNKGKEWWNSAF